jgi:hypothetical protein
MSITIFGGAGGSANEITHLTADGNTLGLWTFDGDINDSSGSARHFTTGSYDGYPLNPVGGERCHRMVIAGTDLYQTTAAFLLTGAVSAGMLIFLKAYPAAAVPLIACQPFGGGTGAANNVLYRLRVGTAGVLDYLHQHDSKQNEAYTSALTVPLNEWCWVGFSRTTGATPTLVICLNGDTESTVLGSAATDGGNGELMCCTEFDGTNVTALISNLIVKNTVVNLPTLGRLTNLGF